MKNMQKTYWMTLVLMFGLGGISGVSGERVTEGGEAKVVKKKNETKRVAWGDSIGGEKGDAHGGGKYRQKLKVVGLAFSSDGQKLMAGYYRAAMNRPGTDWGAWVAQWDLLTGERRIVKSAVAPIAFGDWPGVGKRGPMFAMGYYEEPRERWKRRRPIAKLGLWRLGDRKPRVVFARRSRVNFAQGGEGNADDTVVVATYVGRGNERNWVSLNESGELLLWDEKEPARAAVLAKTDLRAMATGWWLGDDAKGQGMWWNGEKKVLKLRVVSRTKRMVTKEMSWKLDVKTKTVKQIEDKEVKATADAAGVKTGLTVFGPRKVFKTVAEGDGRIKIYQVSTKKAILWRVLRLDDIRPSEPKVEVKGEVKKVRLQFRVQMDAVIGRGFMVVEGDRMTRGVRIDWMIGQKDRAAFAKFHDLLRRVEEAGINGVDFACEGAWIVKGHYLRVISVPQMVNRERVRDVHRLFGGG